ncbi:bifunctional 2-polyprenyl-6-hydroxyphenol methylase/3-demethylubiquinol 3-O-methyltransferase UbiG [Marinomonas posidonica]|uniref:Ubiquinone biosynthesis O-methyltransferase n=1 Tax=Marinomonas posidonica (strain CECT 7376 / NCIMB 14433 / IVIA-Po-181) TaxID=491952 RepID=F6CVE6_MARPP|nr:bifunctional 2-polyprenyl-6-hydroxyphenol methylase/3-demethylubiquinol 3-O-methyltransferase UbiG [Marinomonas posidonica]AEF54256.1 3-demethylubiquinone-9 3-methyltransferase [Marinomonas posidonica IVIA-Po-181]
MTTNTQQTNVDLDEVAKFEALASRWWDTENEFKPLHDINPLRTNYINERAGLEGKKIIDIGCGGGILSEAMAQHGAQVKGIDMGEAPLAVAKLHLEESNLEIDYERITAEQIAEREAGQYDVVTCLEMLEHVPDPASVIRACMTLVKPGGHVFFSTINRNPKAYLFAIIGAEYILNMLPKGTHDYAKFIQPAELNNYARKAGLEVQHMTGMTYNPLTKVYKLTDKDVSVNYLMHTQKPTA